ncbi:MAG: NAD(P)/FAD-dependent oxidoreductase [Bryobacteraceae bacterium]
MANHTPRIVILGGGFAGMNAARSLAHLPVDITLVDRRNFHLFQPLLYQVATGGLSPGDITAPLRGVLRQCKNVRVLLGEAIDIRTDERQVLLAGGASLPYDMLFAATGAENFYFGNDAWRPHAPGLKTLEDATEIRARILGAFEQAEKEPDRERRKAWLRFVVVGAGPTGVELAGAISEIANDTLRDDFRTIRPEESEILLIEGAERVLPPFPPDLSDKAERALLRIGVRSRTGVRVTNVDREGVTIETAQGSQRIESRTVIWAAGIRSSPLGARLAERTGAAVDRGGRVHVEPDLSVAGHPEVFVLGDLAHFVQDGKPLAGVCPVAMQEGWHVARVVKARLAGRPAPPFHYRDKGVMATIGRHAAVADLGFIRFGGILAWLAWLFVHILYLVGFRNRLLVMIQWGFQYVTFNRGARLITGKSEGDTSCP